MLNSIKGKKSPVIGIISYERHENVYEIIRLLKENKLFNMPIIVFLSAGKTKSTEIASEKIKNLGETCFIPNQKCSIGKSRQALVEIAYSEFKATHLIFLDDDCFPENNWIQALLNHLEYFPESGMFFGPRKEYSSDSLGGFIRQRESRKSSKIKLLSNDKETIELPLALCAGGNMGVRIDLALQFGIFDKRFEGCSFEDVDFQLILEKNNISTHYISKFCVVHKHPLSVLQLMKKSIASGRGIAIMQNKHGVNFYNKTRWANWKYFFLYPILLLVVFFLSLFLSKLFFLFILVYLFLEFVRSKKTFFLWFVIKSFRDFFIIVGLIVGKVELFLLNEKSIEKRNVNELKSDI
ncbi:glycosyltransferase [Acinetobacter sp. AOR15_HL]|uniref:glycosyltransferase family 2 protein n=1 Tax=unclassified Acinetobacter TaxID=196816 RepID=UPI0022EAB33A|nr:MULTISPECIES: glycosyltransferase family 2 protein [unclassified Acinetobacter]MDA3556159.1 glycosyltransferase [Acinetobacter sp. AOR15_HL]MDA3571616.1 glycosyltransferase [Acinetobacter sp. AOR14_HL]